MRSVLLDTIADAKAAAGVAIPAQSSTSPVGCIGSTQRLLC